MLVRKSGFNDILGFICDMCTNFTSTDVIPNEHGEFRYICPRCGHHMKEIATEKKEEKPMVNSYTVENAASRLGVSKSTIIRGIFDGRFSNCFQAAGYNGRPAWMIPSDQVEEWVTKGGFLQSPNNNKFDKQSIANARRARAASQNSKKPNERTVYDPETKKEVPVVNLLTEADYRNDRQVTMGIITKRDETGKAVTGRYPFGTPVKRVAGPDGYHGKVIATKPVGGDTDGDSVLATKKEEKTVDKKMLAGNSNEINLTISADVLRSALMDQMKKDISARVGLIMNDMQTLLESKNVLVDKMNSLDNRIKAIKKQLDELKEVLG